MLKMKSLLTKIISVLIIGVLAVSLCACNDTPLSNETNCNNGHTWKLTSTTATCFVGGIENYECEVCKETKTETVEAYGHNLVQSSYTAPTCKTTGEEVKKCSRCGFESKQTLLTIECDYQVKSTVPSTCTVKGSQTLECSMCHATKNETLPLKEHDYKETISPTATCFSNGSIKNICNDCQHEEIIGNTALLTHKFGDDGYCGKCGIHKTLFEINELKTTYSYTINNGYAYLYLNGFLTPKMNNDLVIADEYWITHTVTLNVSLLDENQELLQAHAFNSQIITYDGKYKGKMTIQHSHGGISNAFANQFNLFLSDDNVFENENLMNCKYFKIEISCEGYETIEKTYEITEA